MKQKKLKCDCDCHLIKGRVLGDCNVCKCPSSFINKIIRGDCVKVMKDIEDKSIDMILADLPYGTTACSWDTIIPFEPLWEQYKRIIKDNGAIVLTASQPFTSALVMSNPSWFRYEMIWEKDYPTNPYIAKKQIMKRHENILIFYKKQSVFNPQMIEREKGKFRNNKKKTYVHRIMNKDFTSTRSGNEPLVYPSSIQKFNRDRQISLHPTQKPVALFEYLIKTYTNEGDLVLDNCIGSGTTAVACKNLNRNFIGIEKELEYCKIAEDRLRQEVLDLAPSK